MSIKDAEGVFLVFLHKLLSSCEGFLRFLFNEIQAILGYESKKVGSKCNFFLKMFGSYKKIAIFASNSMLSGVIFEPVRAWVGAY